MNSIWKLGHSGTPARAPLDGLCEVDTAVIGAGITGLSTALKLAETGKSVAIVEAQQIGAGSTGRSTGNLYSTVSLHLAKLQAKHDAATIKNVVQVRQRAVNFIEKTATKYSIDCDFERRPMYLCAGPSTQQQSLLQELDACLTAGVAAREIQTDLVRPLVVHKAIQLDNQAQFNPQRYVDGLARAVENLGVKIFENSSVLDVDAAGGRVATKNGEVHARNIVFATHTPKGINLLQAEMEVYHEYGVSAKLQQGAYPHGLLWLRDEGISLRSYAYQGDEYLIVVGSKHKAGEGKLGAQYYENLREFAREHFAVDNFVHHWSAQQYKPADLLPYIGRSAHQNVYVATGFAADGLTWGAAAADIISRQICGESDIAAAELFNPRRFTPLKSAKNWIKENTAVAKNLVQGHLSSADKVSLEQIEPGQGKVVEINHEKIAAFRSADNALSLVSAVCPHMKCVVSWNGADATWDCPCHGSRFTTDGDLIEGPAYENLAVRTFNPQ